MAWLEITISTLPHSAQEVAARLTAGGFADLVLEDQQELEGFLEENRAYWDYIDDALRQRLQGLSRIRLYLEQSDTQGHARLEALLASLRQDSSLGALAMTETLLPETDWEQDWKVNYPPQEVGRNLVVLPYWLEDSSGRIPIILDPGLAFGTGAHASTQMVLEVMEDWVKPGMRCLDLGSGSGILSIAALRLGAKSAVGVDIDPKAEDAARENAAYNHFSAPAFTALTGNVTDDRHLMDRLKQTPYDLVLVNIVADVILGLSPVLPQFLTEKSLLVCSGILDSRLPEVTAALEKAGLAVTAVHAKQDWRCVEAKRR